MSSGTGSLAVSGPWQRRQGVVQNGFDCRGQNQSFPQPAAEVLIRIFSGGQGKDEGRGQKAETKCTPLNLRAAENAGLFSSVRFSRKMRVYVEPWIAVWQPAVQHVPN